jgi:hypothetical protein
MKVHLVTALKKNCISWRLTFKKRFWLKFILYNPKLSQGIRCLSLETSTPKPNQAWIMKDGETEMQGIKRSSVVGIWRPPI